REILAHSWTQEFSWTYVPDPKGLIVAREAIVKYYLDRYSSSSGSNEDSIWITSGTSEAYSFLFKTLTKPGDEVLVEIPGYPLVSVLAELENCRPIPINWREGGSILTTLESVVSSRTKILCLVSPNNPTGIFVSDEEFLTICDFARKHSIAIIIDEVFSDYGLDIKQINFHDLVGDNLNVFLLNGVSKMACLPGWKLGWINYLSQSIEGEEISKRLDWLGDSYLSCNSISQELLPTIFDSRFLVLNQVKNRIRRNLQLVHEMLQDSHWLLEYGGAGWYGQLVLNPNFHSLGKILNRNSSQEFSLSEKIALELLEKENIFLYPGTVFSYPAEDLIFVISLLTPEDTLQQAITKLTKIY
ncbi:MAG: pyridoxal phosphate-dependent aminotransferase, partial [Leptospira sp.]|nr:pyridoxal phosphate-dependent aminotransferase [Leptospira sp.]